MLVYLRKEALALVILLLVASFLIFSVVYLAPGDPLSALLGNTTPSPQRVAELRAQFNLDKPFFEQYLIWLGHALQGNLGESTQFQQPVKDLLVQGLHVSVPLIAYAMTLVLLIGIGSAALASRFPGTPDAVVAIGTSVGVAIPTFVASVVLAMVFAVGLGWFPATGSGDGFVDTLWHLTLPAIALSIGLSALLSRIGRSAMREELESPHVITEEARGVASGRIFRRHVLKNSTPPMLAVIGLQIPALIAGTVVVEQAFNLGGVGSLLLSGVNSHDYPVVQAVALFIVVVTVLTGVCVDLVNRWIDPRILIGDRA